ncbi:MAG: DNA-3-methyladenine glycosylase [Deltaproteobacteria bacterium]|nr:DNA-3-methyladenine glycosylase [Deltaproteobacteria bacterium]
MPASWFARDASIVARELIGCALVHRQRAGIIVETEAYGGPEDLASHARFGPTARTSVMFGPGGISYVYLCYGLHQLFNVVTGVEGEGQAVLIRAIAPHLGLPVDSTIGRGPGKVSTALALDRRHDRRDLARGALFIASAQTPPAVSTGPRIGVAFAGAWAERPLRFWWRDHPSVSGQRAQSGSRGPVAAARTVSTRRSR